jgi:hypothetical protein
MKKRRKNNIKIKFLIILLEIKEYTFTAIPSQDELKVKTLLHEQ